MRQHVNLDNDDLAVLVEAVRTFTPAWLHVCDGPEFAGTYCLRRSRHRMRSVWIEWWAAKGVSEHEAAALLEAIEDHAPNNLPVAARLARGGVADAHRSEATID